MAKHVLGLLLGLAVAMALLAAGADAVTCNTNGNSPTQGDANDCVHYIRNLGSAQCCQVGGGGFSCTTMCSRGGGRVQVCGASGACTQCRTAGDALNEVLGQCTRNVGGTARCTGSVCVAGLIFVIDANSGVDLMKNSTAQVIQMVE